MVGPHGWARVAVAAALLAGCTGSTTPGASGTPGATTTPAPTTTGTPNPDAGKTWAEACRAGEPAPGTWVHDVATTASEVVVAGELPPDPSGTAGPRALWRSPDAVTWRRTDLPTNAADFPRTLAARGDLVVVGGAAGEDDAALAWTADASGAWSRSELLADAGVFGAAAGPTGFVMVGTAGRHTDAARPAIWSSADGGRWQRVEPMSDGRLYGSFDDVVNTGSRFIAFGQVSPTPIPALADFPIPDDRRYEGVPWISEDGVAWRPLDAPGLFAWAHISAIAVAPGRLTALGWLTSPTDGKRTPAGWASSDGLAWTRIALHGTVQVGPVTTAVADSDGRIVAFGDGSEPGGFWVSDDGVAWEAVVASLFTDATISAVTGFGQRFVAVGLRPETCGVWSSPA